MEKNKLDTPLKILEAYHRHKEALTIGIKTENNPEVCVKAIETLLLEARKEQVMLDFVSLAIWDFEPEIDESQFLDWRDSQLTALTDKEVQDGH